LARGESPADLQSPPFVYIGNRHAEKAFRQSWRIDGGPCSPRVLYRTLELPDKNPLRDAHDAAVRAAYGMKPNDDPLAFLLALNQQVAAREAAGEAVVAPGLPPCVTDAGRRRWEDQSRPPEGMPASPQRKQGRTEALACAAGARRFRPPRLAGGRPR